MDEGKLSDTVSADETVHRRWSVYSSRWHVGRDGMTMFVSVDYFDLF